MDAKTSTAPAKPVHIQILQEGQVIAVVSPRITSGLLSLVGGGM